MDDIGIDLAYLVDTPDERLDVEYKSAIELGDKIQRAKLARHIAALANFGGGYVVTGFNDDLSPSKTAPSPISRDDVSSIVKTYLEPAFHCTVRTVRSAAGRDHYVIVIPSHGAAPICVKANGPDSGKKIEGVQQGTYYIRKPGPESAPIITATDWKDVIRRCALYERASILAALEHALAGRGGSESQLNEADRLNKKLETWHRVAAAAYRDSIEKHGSGVENLAGRNFQYSYLIDSSQDGPSLENLMPLLESAEREVDAAARSGWPLFIFYRGPGGADYRTSPELDNGLLEYVEINCIRDGSRVAASDFWRISAEGLATTIRGYIEDKPGSDYEAGVSFSPNWLVRNLAELVAHATALARSFPNSTRILFRCEWNGLQGRMAHDPYRRWLGVGKRIADERRVVVQEVSLGAIVADPLDVVQSLAGPLLRALGVADVTGRSWFESEANSWASRLGKNHARPRAYIGRLMAASFHITNRLSSPKFSTSPGQIERVERDGA